VSRLASATNVTASPAIARGQARRPITHAVNKLHYLFEAGHGAFTGQVLRPS
jgi:hypothetical protein